MEKNPYIYSKIFNFTHYDFQRIFQKAWNKFNESEWNNP